MKSDFVRIFEMGPRDGLQNEKQLITTSDKVHLVDLLSQCGFEKIEVTSFVNPKWVPQMADAADVLAAITRVPGVAYSALTPNLKGYERAISAGVDEVAVFASATESFSQKNLNCSIAESLQRFVPLVQAAKSDGVPVRGYVSCVAGCPYEGEVAPSQVAQVVEQLMLLGCYEISLGDTIGSGRPETIAAMLSASLQIAPADKLAGHYHDTNGRALDNIQVSLEQGLRVFDTAIAGLGGCPFAPGAKGNVATGPVVEMLQSLGYTTGINLPALSTAEQFAQECIRKNNNSIKTGNAL